MLGSGTSKADADAFVAKSLRHQRAQGSVGVVLSRGWPLALISLAVGIWLLATR
jgi:hypothetical protein